MKVDGVGTVEVDKVGSVEVTVEEFGHWRWMDLECQEQIL